MDLAPTILAMAGVSHPAPRYKGREIVPMRGCSWTPFLTGESPRIHPEDFIQGWVSLTALTTLPSLSLSRQETCGRAAVRHGDWKAVFIPKPKGPEKWQLYNLRSDPGEIHDLAEQESDRMNVLMKLWDQYVLETGVVPLAPELGAWLHATEEQMTEDIWIKYRYWEDGAREDPDKWTSEPPRFQRTVKPM